MFGVEGSWATDNIKLSDAGGNNTFEVSALPLAEIYKSMPFSLGASGISEPGSHSQGGLGLGYEVRGDHLPSLCCSSNECPTDLISLHCRNLGPTRFPSSVGVLAPALTPAGPSVSTSPATATVLVLLHGVASRPSTGRKTRE